MIAKSVPIKDAGGKSGGRAYRGRSAARLGFETEDEAIHPDLAAEVSSGRSTHGSEEGPNSESE